MSNEYNEPEAGTDSLRELYADVHRDAGRLEVLHADRLCCQRGCSACCVDDLTVFEIETDAIRRAHPALLTEGVPHQEGACAFLDEAGACRIYDNRPYVCRTQGLPLRWLEQTDGEGLEQRDICPLNDAGAPVTELPAGDCWTIGPCEERLGALQRAHHGSMQRVRLRDLFRRSARDHQLEERS